MSLDAASGVPWRIQLNTRQASHQPAKSIYMTTSGKLNQKSKFSTHFQPRNHLTPTSLRVLTMSKILTVFGATGKQGGSVIRAVLTDAALTKEFKIRAVTRDASKPSLARNNVEVVSVRNIRVGVYGTMLI